MKNIKTFNEYIQENSSDKYAGQRKVSNEIDKKVKKANAESDETKKKRQEKNKLFYYNRLKLMNQKAKEDGKDENPE